MINKNYTPIKAHNLIGVSEADWLQMRTEGLGGSDAARVLGISPWGTKRDLWAEKVGIQPFTEDKNEMILQAGHRLEDLVARLYEYLMNSDSKGNKTSNVSVHTLNWMYRHPLFPFMQADVDRLVIKADGSQKILEIKTTDENNRKNWFDSQGKEIIPPYYECQVRHYMAVMNIDEADVCCLFCNEQFRVLASLLKSDVKIPDELFSSYAEEYFLPNLIVRHITRDEMYEENLINAEKTFWDTYVVPKVEPPVEKQDGNKAKKAILRYRQFNDGVEEITTDISSSIKNIEAIDAKIAQYKSAIKMLEKSKEADEAILLSALNGKNEGFFEKDDVYYKVDFKKGKPSKRILAKDLKKLEAQYPEVAEKFVSFTNPTAKLKLKKYVKSTS